MWTSQSPEETVAIGQEIGDLLSTGDVLCLDGALGAGKTTLIKGIVARVTGCRPETVTSPTFTYLHIYEGVPPLYHFDLYRLPGPEQVLALGLDEYFSLDGICCIEWPDRLGESLPPRARFLHLRHNQNGTREISYG